MFDSHSIHERLQEFFPEVKIFSVPFREIKIDKNSPGKLIDIANAIFEKVGKNAWKAIATSPPSTKIEKAKLSDILKNAEGYFRENDPNFCEELYMGIIEPASRIRGKRDKYGDISHGHLYDKEELSFPHAVTALNLSLTYAAYYFHIIDYISGKMDYDKYSNKGGFNEWLDEKGKNIGGASYSWLVYSHDYTAYEGYYDEYQLQAEQG